MGWRIAGVALLVAVAATGCGGKPDGCTALDPGVAQAVVNGATADLKVRPAGMAIRGENGVYYAAFRIVAAGSDTVGVWALTQIDPPGGIRSVDGYAQQFTQWPTLEGANGSPAARDAIACLG